MPVALTNMSRETSYVHDFLQYQDRSSVHTATQAVQLLYVIFLPSIIRDLSFFIGRGGGGGFLGGGASEHFRA